MILPELFLMLAPFSFLAVLILLEFLMVFGPPIHKHNARMMGFKKSPYALKQACTAEKKRVGWDLPTQCSHDVSQKESDSLQQAANTMPA